MTAIRWTSSRGPVWLIVCWAATLGCGKEAPTRGTTTGQVTVAGQPVTDALIVFEDAAGTGLWAELGPDGSYSIDTHTAAGLPEGTYRVAIRPRPGAGTDPDATSPVPGVVPRPSLVPTRYHRFETSGLVATVQAGNNPPFNFDLTGK